MSDLGLSKTTLFVLQQNSANNIQKLQTESVLLGQLREIKN